MAPDFSGLGKALLLLVIVIALACFGLGYWTYHLIN